MPQIKNLKSRLTLNEFKTLHETVDRARPSTIEIKILRSSLMDLTSDNLEMLSLLPVDTHTPRPIRKGLYYPTGLQDVVNTALSAAKRKNSKLIEIDKKILLHMLIDHSILIVKLEDEGYEIC